MKYEKMNMIGDSIKVRYLLKKEGYNPLIVIGVNPSKATDIKSDSTITRIMGFVEYNGFDSFIMLNLYPQRCTNPKDLDKEINMEYHKENLRHISQTVSTLEHPVVLLAFGDMIEFRCYLKQCLKEIVAVLSLKNPQWKQIDTLTTRGNPRHPLRTKYCELSDFDINMYLNW